MGKKVDKSNIDGYYELVNTKMDDYFGNNVTPQGLNTYFSNEYGINKFMKREELDDVDGIKRIIKDVIEDRLATDENVKTFEQYNTKVDRFKVNFDITQDIEKAIADLYRVSLGHVESKQNKIKLKGIKKEQELYVFTNANLKVMYYNIATNMYDVFVHDLSFEYAPLDIKVDIDTKIIDREVFINSFYSNIKDNIEIIEELLYTETGHEYKQKNIKNDDFMIFEKS
jgi:hypothetical protein